MCALQQTRATRQKRHMLPVDRISLQVASPTHHVWIHVLPTPIACPLKRAEEAETSQERLLALSSATEALLQHLALVVLLEQSTTQRHVPEILEILVGWLRRPLTLEEMWRMVREGLRAVDGPTQRWIPRPVFYAPNGRYTATHTEIQRLIELYHLVIDNPALSPKELENIERRLQPEVRIYRIVAALDSLWRWEICTALTPVEDGTIRARVWRGPQPHDDLRPWSIPPEACLFYHPKEAMGESLPPFTMGAYCGEDHDQTAQETLPVLAFFAPGEDAQYLGWLCHHPVDVHRGLERCRAFLDAYERTEDTLVLHEEGRAWEDELSSRQREIVQADAPQILVVAGAGSGKTRVLTYRIAHLIQNMHMPPDRILAVTFTNRAAREMRHRLRELLGASLETEEMWVGTFHSVCLRILREDIQHLGYQTTFSVVDREAQEILLEESKADARYELRQDTRERIAQIVESLEESPAQEALRTRQIRQALSLYRRKHPQELTLDDLIGMGIARWGTEFGHQYLLRAQALEPEHPDLVFLLECFERQLLFHEPGSELADRISLVKDRLQDPKQVLSDATTHSDQGFAEIYRRYQDKLRDSNLLDFGDLIMLTWKLFREFPEVLQKYQQQFGHVLVDEFQDINSAQDRWLRMFATQSHIFGVGDADQLIYEWRGANVETILEYEQEYTRVVLEENYRSGRRILAAANGVIQHNAMRQDKALRAVLDREGSIYVCAFEDEGGEAEFVAKRIREMLDEQNLNLSDIAILYRINAKAERFRQVLQESEIPHRVIGGQRFYEQPEIRHALNYLRLVYNPHDRVSLKLLLRAQLQPTWVAHLEDFAREQGRDFFYALGHLDDVPQLDEYAQEQLRQMLAQLRTLRESIPDPTEPLDIAAVLRHSIVTNCLLQPPELPPMPLTYLQHLSLEELFSIAQRFRETENDQTIQAFLEYIALFSRQDDLQTSEADAVTLMTMHSGKGLEFEVVFVVGCVDGLIPLLRRSRDILDISPEQLEQMELRQLEEERRLFYVSLTRAKSSLYLTYPETRQTATGTGPTNPSRFIEEIPEQSYQQYVQHEQLETTAAE